jgi:actin-related protein 9
MLSLALLTVLDPPRHHLFTYQFGQPPRENSTSLILVPPPTRSFVNSNALLAKYTQLAFESLNCSTFAVLPWPIASLFGVGAVTGMVVHVGSHSTEIAVVVESTVRTDVAGCVEVGREDCIRHLSTLLSTEAGLQDTIRSKIEDSAVRKTHSTVDSAMRELAETILDDEDRSKIVIPLASGSKAVVAGDDVLQEEEEGVLNVAKMCVKVIHLQLISAD